MKILNLTLFSYFFPKVCKQIWLGLFDDRSSAIPDFRDPQKVKEFLQEKYEKKRWWVDVESLPNHSCGPGLIDTVKVDRQNRRNWMMVGRYSLITFWLFIRLGFQKPWLVLYLRASMSSSKQPFLTMWRLLPRKASDLSEFSAKFLRCFSPVMLLSFQFLFL